MEKSKEIEILQSLKGATYFNATFSKEDIDRMCQNIRNDYPIEWECDFMKKTESLEAKIEMMEKEHSEEVKKILQSSTSQLKEFGKQLISTRADTIENVYQLLTKQFGIPFIIKTKRELGIELSEDEIDYLIDQLA